jgi:mycothiol synthase
MAGQSETSGPVPFDPTTPSALGAVEALLARAERKSGSSPLSDASRLALGGDGSPFTGVVERSGDHIVGYAHVGWRDRAFTIEIALDPDADPAVRGRLLRAAVAVAERDGAHEIRVWDIAHHDDDPALAELGFGVERDLFQMRVPLPLPLAVERRALPGGLRMRSFEPGRDEERWLEVNNRAFAAHPEQGHWVLEDLVAREASDWFDPAGFLLCEDGAELAASCWTKVHARHDPPLGEIYVISVNPDFQGRGLGRVLTVAGLDWLARRVGTGMLYVDSSNEAAVALYRSLDFEIDHVDRCYLRRDG